MDLYDGLAIIIDKYVKSPDSRSFSEIFELAKKDKIPINVYQSFLNTREYDIPNYQLGLFNILLDRQLDAIYYLDLHLKENPDDLLAWVNFQYIAAQRGDANNTYKALCKILEIGHDIEKCRAEIIYLLLLGYMEDADEAARYLADLNAQDDLSVSIIYEVAVMADDWILISWLTGIVFGRHLLSSANGFNPLKMKRVIVSRIIDYCKNRIEDLKNGGLSNH